MIECNWNMIKSAKDTTLQFWPLYPCLTLEHCNTYSMLDPLTELWTLLPTEGQHTR